MPAPDRAARVVDQHVHRRVIAEDLADDAVDRVHVGQVGRVRGRRPAGLLDLLLDLLELVQAAGDEDRDAARGGDLHGRRLADAAGGAGDDHRLAVDGALERAVLEQVGIEVALPVVPQLVGVGLELGHLDARAGERSLGVAGVELGGQGDVLEDLVGDAVVGEDRPAHVLDGGELHRHPHGPGRQRLDQARVDPQGHLRRVRRGGERVHGLAGALRLGRAEVEGLTVEAGLVRDVVHRGGHEVDRHDVRVAHLRADQGQPLRQVVPQLLDRLEEVVGAVDLVHLAGLRVADDDGRPVHAPGALGLRAGDLLGLELRAVVGMVERLALVEHVLAEQALVRARRGDRGDVVEDPRVDRRWPARPRCVSRRR